MITYASYDQSLPIYSYSKIYIPRDEIEYHKIVHREFAQAQCLFLCLVHPVSFFSFSNRRAIYTSRNTVAIKIIEAQLKSVLRPRSFPPLFTVSFIHRCGQRSDNCTRYYYQFKRLISNSYSKLDRLGKKISKMLLF